MSAAKVQRGRASSKAKGVVETDARLTAALAEAAWVDADAGLADAIALCDEFALQTRASGRRQILELLTQSLARAARRRGLTRFGVIDAVEAFDPTRHELSDSFARRPKRVRIIFRGVSRGASVLVKARVGPVRRSRGS